MEHLLLKAATTATDQGTFEAVISTASIDRDGDIVEPSAIVKALAKWAALGKMVPLAYSHRDPATGQAVVVGHIDPASARVEGKEAITKGWVDQSTERGAETWRLVKSGTLSFSYGYLVPDGGATKRTGRKTGYHITELDLYEISVVPVAPANNDTRVLSFKSIQDDLLDVQQRLLQLGEKDRLQILEAVKSALGVEPEQEKADSTDQEPSEQAHRVDSLRKQAESVALEFASGGLSLLKPPKEVEQPPSREPELPLQALKQRMRDELLMHLSGETL